MSSIKSLTRFAAIGLAVAVGLLAMAPGLAVAQTTGTWTATAGGSWGLASNWGSNQIAGGVSGSANFSSAISGIQVVTLDGDRTIGAIRFGSGGSANIFSLQMGTSGTLTLQTSSGSPVLDVQTSRSGIIGASLAGTQGLTKVGAGTLYLGGNNTYTGVTEIPSGAGTIDIVSTQGFGATGAGNHTLLTGGRARIGWDGITYEDFTVNASNSNGAISFSSSQTGVVVSSTVAGQVTLGANARFDAGSGSVGTYDRVGSGGHSIDLQTFTGTFAGAGETRINSPIIGSGGSFISNGSGPVILAAANTYSGSTAIMNNATVTLGNGGTGGSIANSSAFYMHTTSATFRVNQSDTVTQGVDFPVITSSGAAGVGTFTQLGSGTTVLNAANAYKGATNVDAGTLLINGNQSGATGAVTVAAGATLGGSGTTGGAVTVNGILSPGNSPGVLTVASVVLGASSTAFFEINGTTRGTQYDGLDVTTASGVTYDGALSLSFGNGSAFANNTTFDLFSFTGTPSGNFSSVTSTGFYAGTWTLASGTWSLDVGSQKLSFTPSTGDLIVAVPEPSTLVLLGSFAVIGFLVHRRRA